MVSIHITRHIMLNTLVEVSDVLRRILLIQLRRAHLIKLTRVHSLFGSSLFSANGFTYQNRVQFHLTIFGNLCIPWIYCLYFSLCLLWGNFLLRNYRSRLPHIDRGLRWPWRLIRWRLALDLLQGCRFWIGGDSRLLRLSILLWWQSFNYW